MLSSPDSEKTSLSHFLSRRDSRVLEEIQSKIRKIFCPLLIRTLLQASPGLHSLVLQNVTRLDVPENYLLDWSLLKILPKVQEVRGWISVDPPDLPLLSTQIHGSLRVRVSSFHPFLFSCFFSRVHLFPESETLLLTERKNGEIPEGMGYQLGSLALTVSLLPPEIEKKFREWLPSISLNRLAWRAGELRELLEKKEIRIAFLGEEKFFIPQSVEIIQGPPIPSLTTLEPREIQSLISRSWSWIQGVGPRSSLRKIDSLLFEWSHLSLLHQWFPALRRISIVLVRVWSPGERLQLLTPETEEKLSSFYREELRKWRKEGRRYKLYFL